MLNIEKYLDELTEGLSSLSRRPCIAIIDGAPRIIEDNCIGECELHHYDPPCLLGLMQWLAKEYEEPKVSIPPDTPIDAKILVSDDGKNWGKRHYAGLIDGKHYAWVDGLTSWSADSCKAPWGYMKLAEEE